MNQLNSHMFEDTYKALGINLDTLGCIMADVEPIKIPFQNENWLYYAKDKTRFWIDGYTFNKIAHLTLLYGLLESGQKWKAHVDAVLKDWNMKSVEIENVGYFNSPYKDEPYYCIVGHVKLTDELLEGHQRLEFLPHINTFNGYKPHITLAYVKKDDVVRKIVITWFTEMLKGKKLNVKQLNYGK